MSGPDEALHIDDDDLPDMSIAKDDARSTGQWRLQADGVDVFALQLTRRTNADPIVHNGPVCGNTKAECIDKALALLARIAVERKHLIKQIKEIER